MVPRTKRNLRSWLRLLLLIPLIAMLWPPFYNAGEPSLIGIPFFYWYQIAWIVLASLLMIAIYLLED